MAREPIWADEAIALAIHGRQISEHGGDRGVCDTALLSSALAKPRNLFEYSPQEADIPRLAAAYLYGIVNNHPFIDGNKRTGLVVCGVFLRLNGKHLTASLPELYAMVMAVASGEMDEEEIAEFIRTHTQTMNERE